MHVDFDFVLQETRINIIIIFPSKSSKRQLIEARDYLTIYT
jgi:hypothetical protein